MDFLHQHIEALIFATPQPIAVEDISAALSESLQAEVTPETVLEGIKVLCEQYADPRFSFDLMEIAEGWQFLTKGAYYNTVAAHLKLTTKKRLSQAAMETLALVAYKQPVTKSELEATRGVSCDYAMHKLLEKELVVITGRSESPGRPLLYGTSDKFMDYLGIKSLEELPKPKDFKEIENTIGEMPALEEETPTIDN